MDNDGVLKQITIGVIIAVLSALIVWKLGLNQTEASNIDEKPLITQSTPSKESETKSIDTKEELTPTINEQNYNFSQQIQNATEGEPKSKFNIVGMWETNVRELNVQIQIKLNLEPNGEATYYFLTPNGESTQNSYWRYSNGYLIEQFQDGGYGKGKVLWKDENTFELTIVDNGVPAYTGIKRIYVRQN